MKELLAVAQSQESHELGSFSATMPDLKLSLLQACDDHIKAERKQLLISLARKMHYEMRLSLAHYLLGVIHFPSFSPEDEARGEAYIYNKSLENPAPCPMDDPDLLKKLSAFLAEETSTLCNAYSDRLSKLCPWLSPASALAFLQKELLEEYRIERIIARNKRYGTRPGINPHNDISLMTEKICNEERVFSDKIIAAQKTFDDRDQYRFRRAAKPEIFHNTMVDFLSSEFYRGLEADIKESIVRQAAALPEGSEKRQLLLDLNNNIDKVIVEQVKKAPPSHSCDFPSLNKNIADAVHGEIKTLLKNPTFCDPRNKVSMFLKRLCGVLIALPTLPALIVPDYRRALMKQFFSTKSVSVLDNAAHTIKKKVLQPRQN